MILLHVSMICIPSFPVITSLLLVIVGLGYSTPCLLLTTHSTWSDILMGKKQQKNKILTAQIFVDFKKSKIRQDFVLLFATARCFLLSQNITWFGIYSISSIILFASLIRCTKTYNSSSHSILSFWWDWLYFEYLYKAQFEMVKCANLMIFILFYSYNEALLYYLSIHGVLHDE